MGRGKKDALAGKPERYTPTPVNVATDIMITRTPPRRRTFVERKRGWPMLASSSSSSSSAAGRIANDAAATVSPFADRVPSSSFASTGRDGVVVEPLEPVPEEGRYGNLLGLLSQSSSTANASCPTTFDGDDAHDDDACDSSACSVDFFESSVGYHPPEETAAGGGDAMACGGPSSSSFFAASAYHYSEQPEFRTPFLDDDDHRPMPPTKRARLEEDTPDEDMSSGGSTPSPPTWGVEIDEAACDGRCCAADYEKMASDRVDVDLGENNIDGQNNGIASCHVCSADAPSGPAAATTTSLDVRRGGRVGGAPGGPRSRSLLAYFQPTKRTASSHPHHGAQVPNYCPASSASSDRGVGSSSNPVPASSNGLPPCRYCDKPTCPACARRCEMCHRRFCIFCTKVNYESSVVERVFCFECDERWRDDDGCGIVGVGGGTGAEGGGTSRTAT